MNHADPLGAKQLFTPLRFRCQQVFSFRESFFRGPAGATRWREGDVCLIFKPASRTFLPSGKISFPVALADMASSLARTALCAFSATPSSIFPQKILHSCPLPALPFPACRKDTPGYRHPPLPLSCFSSDNASVPAVPGNKTPRAFPPCGPRPAGLHAARRAKTWHPSPQGRLPAHRHFPPPRTLPAFQPLSGNKKGSPKAPRSCDVRLMPYAA